jgi:hypothetical protein
MAKTTRKTETTTTAAKPAARRKTNGVPAADSLKTAPRRRTKAMAAPARPVAASGSRTARPARPTGTASLLEPTHEEIAIRAYHLYLSRRGWPGSPEHDWLQAKNELRRERGLR